MSITTRTLSEQSGPIKDAERAFGDREACPTRLLAGASQKHLNPPVTRLTGFE